MDQSIINSLVCPVCKSELYLDREKSILVCKADKLAYPIRENIPVMLVEEAIKLNIEEIKKYG
ncbi:Trm112 family protein [Francisellaceae bacterium CB300]